MIGIVKLWEKMHFIVRTTQFQLVIYIILITVFWITVVINLFRALICFWYKLADLKLNIKPLFKILMASCNIFIVHRSPSRYKG